MITMMTPAERRRWVELSDAPKPTREAIDRATQVKPLVIEIPFAEPAAVPDGRQCELPATDAGKECLRHFRWHALYTSLHALPLPEDALSLQEVLAYTVDMVLSKRTTADEVRAIAELCRVMEKNLVRCERELDAMARHR
jgi:hypothetical protein